MQSFYTVFRINNCGGTIPSIHKTYQEAREEAEHLANKHPTDEFTIMKSVSSCTKSKVHWTEHYELVGPDTAIGHTRIAPPISQGY